MLDSNLSHVFLPIEPPSTHNLQGIQETMILNDPKRGNQQNTDYGKLYRKKQKTTLTFFTPKVARKKKRAAPTD